jgi:hypothetical protein
MGYNTDFEGTLEFTTVLTAEMIDRLNAILGEDCRDHPEWDVPGHLTYINLEINDACTGLEWDGQEKTYEMDGLVNVVIREMRKVYPKFGLTGVLKAQGEDVGDWWEVFIGDDGLAHSRDVVAMPAGTKVKCPHCEHEFQLQESQ